MRASYWLLVAITIAPPALACWDCVQRQLGIRWTPLALAKTERGVRVRIIRAGTPYDVADIAFAGEKQTFVRPADQKEAKQRPTARAIAAAECRRRVPYRHPERDEAIALRPHLRVGPSVEETVGPCVEAEGALWFGLTFYEGEGSDGVGGVGRYDVATKQIEVRRPEWVRDKSIDSLAYDGGRLWLGVAQHYEHDGPSWGLATYDWKSGRLERATGAAAPCGTEVHDLLLTGEELWVTTDLALARLDLASNRWSHYTVRRDGSGFAAAQCPALYRRIVTVAIEHFNDQSCLTFCGEEQIPDQIARIDEDSVRAVVFAMPVPEKNYTLWQTIGSLARTFEELKRYAIDRTSDSLARQYAIGRFAERKPTGKAWRDFALRWAEESGTVEHLRYLRGDHAVFALVTKVAKGEGRQAREAIEMLPWIGGARAIPVLLEILNHPPADPWALDTAIEALERAAHLRIEADGSRTELAANSDTPEYADEEFGAFHRSSKRDPEGTRKIIAQWNAKLQSGTIH
jgi:hypothetical protein